MPTIFKSIRRLTVHRNAHNKEGEYPCIGYEEQIVVVVVDTNAVVDPGAVMVVSFDTGFAYMTVSRPGGLDNLAVWAQLSGLKFLQKLQEVDFGLKFARILSHSKDVRNVHFDADHC